MEHPQTKRTEPAVKKVKSQSLLAMEVYQF